LDYIDEIGVHFYRSKPEGTFNFSPDTTTDIDLSAIGIQSPITFQEEINSLRAFIDAKESGFPIRNTEEGFYFNTPTDVRQDLSQLKYLTRSVLHQRRLGIEEITLFRLRAVKRSDYVSGTAGDDAYRNDYNFPGMIDQTGASTFVPRPVYYALKTLAQYLSDPESKYVQGRTVTVGSLKVHVEIYSRNGKPVIAYWIEDTIVEARRTVINITLNIEGIGDHTYKAVDIEGNTAVTVGAYTVSGNGINFTNLPVTDYPFILYAE